MLRGFLLAEAGSGSAILITQSKAGVACSPVWLCLCKATASTQPLSQAIKAASEDVAAKNNMGVLQDLSQLQAIMARTHKVELLAAVTGRRGG
jgi:hypothetical protein